MTEQTDLAARIATEAHEGQTRWDKETPYISHPAAVARALIKDGYGEEYVATAWLHDVIEDTEVTAKDLLEKGIDHYIVDAVLTLTKRKGESYLDYILNVKGQPVAREVKMADIRHNMSDLKPGSMRDKYSLALYLLEDITI